MLRFSSQACFTFSCAFLAPWRKWIPEVDLLTTIVKEAFSSVRGRHDIHQICSNYVYILFIRCIVRSSSKYKIEFVLLWASIDCDQPITNVAPCGTRESCVSYGDGAHGLIHLFPFCVLTGRRDLSAFQRPLTPPAMHPTPPQNTI